MRALNHEHLFALPLRADNGLDLSKYTGTPRLATAAATLQKDSDYVVAVTELGERYRIARNGSLAHGDFHPGSHLQTAAGVKVIDPKCCFYGDAEFDLEVFAAHVLLADESPGRAEDVFASYNPRQNSRMPLGRQYAEVDIVRRLIDVAQIPPLSC